MNFKLENFFIGVVELFSIILPGSIMTFFLLGQVNYEFFFKDLSIFPTIPSEYNWIAFLIVAYIIGHIINAIGSKLLDDLFYSKLELWNFFTKNNDLTYLVANSIKEKYLNKKDFKKLIENKEAEITSPYKWAKRFLSINSPDVLTEVNRREADQKFFRSLTIVFLIIGLWLGIVIIIERNILILIPCATCILLVLLCLWNYSKIRFKTMETAYEFIIMIYYNKNINK